MAVVLVGARWFRNRAGCTTVGSLWLLAPPSMTSTESLGSAAARRPAMMHAAVPPGLEVSPRCSLFLPSSPWPAWRSSAWRSSMACPTSGDDDIHLGDLLGQLRVQPHDGYRSMVGIGMEWEQQSRLNAGPVAFSSSPVDSAPLCILYLEGPAGPLAAPMGRDGAAVCWPPLLSSRHPAI